MTRILAIETSCDETAAAVIEDGRRIVASVVASQIDLHAQYGGVFPEMASRAHLEAIGAVTQRALDKAGLDYTKLDAIAVTRGPGLPGSLLVGVNFAKGLAMGAGLPLIGVNHLEGHIYALWLMDAPPVRFPAVALIVSGGHTSLVLMTGHGAYRQLGATLDDAAGEAFDKVGRVLSLPYPGGPNIEKAAQAGRADAYDFPLAKPDGTFDFSFSGLKTAVIRAVKAGPGHHVPRGDVELRSDIHVPDVAASFQKAVIDALVIKTAAAARAYKAHEVLLVGGVSANQALRQAMETRAGVPVRYPPLKLCTDNAAMIGAAAHFRFIAGQRDGLDMDVLPMWPIDALPAPARP
ncbi:MAG: tRNA (adenosine(37)-N6)-threonylcarbamoyltransferase complex transferase subunit TsaD [Anaerolineae bacterium]|nr:tRNA (adenosine(37)-N6)-threonylcarbamoyltransferase complex transferase subunit TsaD [Anaerolineae bacterium]